MKNLTKIASTIAFIAALGAVSTTAMAATSDQCNNNDSQATQIMSLNSQATSNWQATKDKFQIGRYYH
ncbi:hypothetical protein [Celerinatantimonas yamalensis]|uniref:Uncharacterized protein n=1 Tax=Celerinatantimonas yamalensis TaxID=559956 RepID=A0ABW9GE37_9GAMM